MPSARRRSAASSIVDSTDKIMEMVVEDSQLSLAIGKKGQNVRLASKLIGWRIDIKSEEEKRAEVESQMEQMQESIPTPLETMPGLTPKLDSEAECRRYRHGRSNWRISRRRNFKTFRASAARRSRKSATRCRSITRSRRRIRMHMERLAQKYVQQGHAGAGTTGRDDPEESAAKETRRTERVLDE